MHRNANSCMRCTCETRRRRCWYFLSTYNIFAFHKSHTCLFELCKRYRLKWYWRHLFHLTPYAPFYTRSDLSLKEFRYLDSPHLVERKMKKRIFHKIIKMSKVGNYFTHIFGRRVDSVQRKKKNHHAISWMRSDDKRIHLTTNFYVNQFHQSSSFIQVDNRNVLVCHPVDEQFAFDALLKAILFTCWLVRVATLMVRLLYLPYVCSLLQAKCRLVTARNRLINTLIDNCDEIWTLCATDFQFETDRLQLIVSLTYAQLFELRTEFYLRHIEHCNILNFPTVLIQSVIHEASECRWNIAIWMLQIN